MRPRDTSSPDPSSILAAVGPPELTRLLQQAHRRRFRTGETVFREGAGSGSVVVLERGRVKVSRVTEDGREMILGVRGPGDVLGELGALDGNPSSASVTALDEVQALVIPAVTFRAMLERDGRLALRVLRVVSSRLRDADRQRVEFGSFDVTTRLASRLLELADRYGEPTDLGMRVDVALSQEELAGWLGCSREAVSKALRRMRDEGWVETGRRKLTILDESSLRRVAGRG